MKRSYTSLMRTAAVFIIAVLSYSFISADPISTDQAAEVVNGWLNQNSRPFQSKKDYSVDQIDPYTDQQGNVLYYCVSLNPDGFVIVSGDDDAEPVIAFVPGGTFNSSAANPLGAFISVDLPSRIKHIKRLDNNQPKNQRINKNRLKWKQLRDQAENRRDLTPLDADPGDTPPPGPSTIDDIRVDPILQSTWGQYGPEGYASPYCYNYYTPSHYPSGCVATAVAQLMRHHEHPSSYPHQVNAGMTEYPDYILMPLSPRYGTITTQQCQEIGMLCYQIGLSIDMDYSSSGSAAITSDAGKRLTDTFNYSNSIEYVAWSDHISNDRLIDMMNPNLDAGLPAILSIRNSTEYYGHAVVCDGYGYNNSTLYHHLNMGWDGRNDVWYALPIIDAGLYNYDLVYTCIYNVYTSGTGEIISGRILDHVGNPVPDVTVLLNGGTRTTQTDSKGIYAFAAVPSNTSYTVSAEKPYWEFNTANISTGRSEDGSYIFRCGNVWGVDLNGQLSVAEIRLDKDLYTSGDDIIITLTDTDLTGNGSQEVILTTTYGDSETISLIETPAASGIFVKAVNTAQSAIIQNNNTLEIWDQDTVTVEYTDLENQSGNPLELTDQAVVTGLTREFFFEDFESGMPSGWEIINGGTGENTWEITYATADNLDTNIMIADSTFFETEEFDEQLISPVFDCSQMSGVALAFDHDFKYYENEICDVDISIDGGPWVNVKRWQDLNTSDPVELDISEWADGKENVRIRWHYYNAVFEWYWAVDNISFKAVIPPMAPIANDAAVSAETAYPETFTLSAEDEGASAGQLEYIITSLPAFGLLADPLGSEITPGMIPYTLINNGNEVVYTANSCFEGWDLFTFQASDGGQAPHGGLSNQADVSIRVWPPTVYYTDFSNDPIADGWSVFDGFSDGFTWQQGQEGNLSFMVVDSDSAGSTVIMDESLISPVFDCSEYNVVYLLYDHYFSYFDGAGVEIGDVDVSIDGAGWQEITTYRDFDYNEFAEFDISDLAAGHSQVQFRWRYHNAQWDDFWAVYEMWLLGVNASPLADIDADCDVDLVDISQLSAAWQTAYGDDNYCYPCDIAEPFDLVDINDLAEVVMFWMEIF